MELSFRTRQLRSWCEDPDRALSILKPHVVEYLKSRLADLRAVVRSTTLKSLTHLRLRLSDMGDKACKEIVDSGILKRLQACATDARSLRQPGLRPSLGSTGRLNTLTEFDKVHTCSL